MFAIFRECADRFIQKCRTKRKLTFAILGLDDAGKTTAAKGLSGEIDHADTSATIGFDKDEIKLGKYEITLFDLGGGKKIRDIWKNYLAEIHGVIFVVDSSTNNRMVETKQVLGHLLEHPSMTGKPLLLLANKQDQIGALDELDICEVLSLEALVNKNRCPCRVESCSASSGTGKKMDPNIVDGIMWLCNLIDQNYDKFTDRIDKEMKDLNIQKEKEAVERKERVRQIREERERQRIASGQAAEEEETRKEDEDLKNGNVNPFKRLDSDYFSKPKETGIDVPSNLPAVESLPSSHFYSSLIRDTEQLLPANTNQNNSTAFLSKSKISVVSPHQDTLLPQKDSGSKGSGQRPNRPLPILLENNSANNNPLLPANNNPLLPANNNPLLLANNNPLLPANNNPLLPANNNPLLPANNNPLLLANNNPLLPANTNPLLPANNNPLLPANNNPLLPANNNPLLPANNNPLLPANNNPLLPANNNPLLPANEDPSQMSMKTNSFLKKTFLQPLDTIDGVAQTNKVKKKKKKLKKNNVAPITNELDPKINSSESTLKNTTHLSFVAQPISSNNIATPKTSEQTSDPFSRKWNLVDELPYMEKLTVEDDDDDIIT